MLESDKLDWAMGELLAYATLLQDATQFEFQGKMWREEPSLHRHVL